MKINEQLVITRRITITRELNNDYKLLNITNFINDPNYGSEITIDFINFNLQIHYFINS